MKLDEVVVKEVKYMSIAFICFSVLVQIIFLSVGKYNYTVLLGSIYGWALAILNFLFLGITIQKALNQDPEEAKKDIRYSYRLRILSLVVFAALGVVLPIFNAVVVLLSLVFPKIYYMFSPIFRKDLK